MLHISCNAGEGRNATQQKQIELNDSKADALFYYWCTAKKNVFLMYH